jgi:hypothetical protein
MRNQLGESGSIKEKAGELCDSVKSAGIVGIGV